MSLLTIGHQFPAYRLTALIGGDLSKVDAQQPGDLRYRCRATRK